ncbi:hypothetical protein [Fredinandcohnia quinoae]|uniref:RNA polymerase subunit sigma n=1 Tax=Fredinandcohnia quinoae TaxID=2918902 RepID=A0AAW5E0V6_9BACI|nr:hypothetical protein [Fredinandcohnia sp. SECRCQ15]MCH1623757.1 hypothetical protein [Fredinandcohnia sp. SECRCQ15]
MSLKLIELQVALPRTQDAGKLSEQLSSRGQQMQDHLAVSIQKKDEKNRKQVNKNNQSEDVNMKKEDSSNSASKRKRQQKNNENEEEQREHHPFKGNFVDISG